MNKNKVNRTIETLFIILFVFVLLVIGTFCFSEILNTFSRVCK